MIQLFGKKYFYGVILKTLCFKVINVKNAAIITPDVIYIDGVLMPFTISNNTVYIENCPNVFTIKVIKDGFNDFESTYNYKTLNNGSLGMTPKSQEEQNMVYLQWTKSTVSDLDTHLQIFKDNVLLKEIYYKDKTYTDENVDTIIDIDDTGSENGENTTIKSLNDLIVDSSYTFKFIVLNWSNKTDVNNKNMSNSNAYTQITYKRLTSIINIPTDTAGVYWEVFNIEKGVLKIINKITTTNDQNIIR